MDIESNANGHYSYKDELSPIASKDDSYFPAFLFKPIKNDFPEDYYRFGSNENIASEKVQALRKKYSNYFDFIDAMKTYTEYMEILYDKYGGKRVIKNLVTTGMMDEFVPSKPRLKNTKRNREFLKLKVVPSRIIDKSIHVSLKDISRELYPDQNGGDIKEMDSLKKLDKKTKKRIASTSEKLAGKSRRRNLYNSALCNNGCDYVTEYLNQLSKGYYTSDGVKKEKSISEMMEEDRIKESMPPELYERMNKPNKSVIQGGRLVNSKDQEQIEIFKDLFEEGFDVFGAMNTSNMSKRSVKMVKRTMGAYSDGPMTKKQLKKYKKRAKKEKEILRDQAKNNKQLNDVLLNNKFSFNNSTNSLSFKLRDLYNEDD